MENQKKILFICNQGENRSRTAAGILEGKGYAVKYDGFHCGSFNPINLEWADRIVVFEDDH